MGMGRAMNMKADIPEGVLRVVCAWCGKHIGDKDGEGKTGISHGICKECEGDEVSMDGQSPD